MKCEECLPRIEEYVDGELDGRMTERVAAHLSTCAGCAQELASLQREQEIYANYQRDIEVSPAQWNIVQARIEQEKDALPFEPRTPLRERLRELFNSRKQFRPAFVAALVLLVVGITAGVLYLTSRGRQTELAQTPKPTATQSPAVVRQDLASESNRNSETITGGANQDQSNSNHQTPGVVVSAPRAGEKKKTAVVAASVPRSENRRSMQPARDASAQFDAAAAVVDNSINGARRNALEASGDFDFEIARHAERAQLLLRSFRNVRLPANNRALDVSYEKENARKLLYQNIALRREAGTRGDQPATEVLNTLEPILLDIANLPNRAKARDVRSIEQHMQKKEIVATLQVRTLVASN
jgi:Putative zinc-finger